MRKALFNILEQVFPVQMNNYLQNKTSQYLIKELRNWQKNNYPAPPPHLLKQFILIEYSRKHDIRTLVETGTFLGTMVDAQKNSFDKIYSIELDEKLFKKAVLRFQKDKNITILQGDSGKVLKTLVPQLKSKTLFWLDGHYSAGITAKADLNTPIIEELNTVLDSGFDHIILIDDARDFNGQNDYPTLDGLKSFVTQKNPLLSFEVKDNIIRIEKN